MSWPVDLPRSAWSMPVGNCQRRAEWCDDVACDVAICVDAGQYCLLCDGAYLGFAASIARWAIVGCGCGFEDAKMLFVEINKAF